MKRMEMKSITSAVLGLTNVRKIGNTYRDNRENWIKKTLSELPVGSKLLDAGAGESQHKKYCDHLEYISQDFAEYDGVGDGKGQQTQTRDHSELDIVSDITDIPVEDHTFDAVMCIEVLEHVPNPPAAIEELDRVLKPKGHLIITAPFSSLTHYSPYHFSSGFNRYFYQHHLGTGYDPIEITPNGNYFEFVASEIKRINAVAKQYSKRKLSWFGLLASAVLINGLYKINQKQTNSDELGCYGYFVLAQKK